MRAAHALADFGRVDLVIDHLHTVLDIGMFFENDFMRNRATANKKWIPFDAQIVAWKSDRGCIIESQMNPLVMKSSSMQS